MPEGGREALRQLEAGTGIPLTRHKAAVSDVLGEQGTPPVAQRWGRACLTPF